MGLEPTSIYFDRTRPVSQQFPPVIRVRGKMILSTSWSRIYQVSDNRDFSYVRGRDVNPDIPTHETGTRGHLGPISEFQAVRFGLWLALGIGPGFGLEAWEG